MDNTTEQDLKTLEALLRVADTKNAADSLLSAFQNMVEALDGLKKDTVQEQEEMRSEVLLALQKLENGLKSIKNGADGIPGVNGIDGKDGLDGEDGEDGEDGIDGLPGKDGKDGSPDTPEEIAGKLNTLTEAVDISTIKGWKELEKRVKGVENRPVSGWSSASGGKIVKFYDLTDKLDASTKTFSLPAFWRVISVHSSSTPNIFRPTIDFTTDAAAMTITFTSQIDASTILATPQTLLVVYAEA